MESEMIPGYDFEYTLDGVIFSRYDKFLKNKYEINYEYIENNVQELLELRDVVVPNFFLRGWDTENLFSKRYHEDVAVEGGQWGIYQWHNIFGHLYERNSDLEREDEIRLALDIAKKYPKHSDIVQLKEVQGDIYDTSPNFDDSFERKVDLFREKLKHIKQMVDKVYSNLINDELIGLNDYVPSLFLSDYAYEKRKEHLMKNGPSWLYDIESTSMSDKFEMENMDKTILNIMFEMDDFLEKYPQYYQLIPDYAAFEKYGNELIQEIEKTGR